MSAKITAETVQFGQATMYVELDLGSHVVEYSGALGDGGVFVSKLDGTGHVGYVAKTYAAGKIPADVAELFRKRFFN